MKTTGGAKHLPICRAEIQEKNYKRYNAANVQEKTSRMIQYEDLHTLIEHLSEMNKKLEKACPLDWSKEKKEIEAKKAELQKKSTYGILNILPG
jgi:hypothetical protein